jgi:hypothetical protein
MAPIKLCLSGRRKTVNPQDELCKNAQGGIVPTHCNSIHNTVKSHSLGYLTTVHGYMLLFSRFLVCVVAVRKFKKCVGYCKLGQKR